MTKQIDELMVLHSDCVSEQINWATGNTSQDTPHLVLHAEAKFKAALEAALKPGKPVAWMFEYPNKRVAPKFDSAPHGGNWKPLYTTPPAQTPAPPPRLTDEQIDAIWPSPEGTNSIRAVARAIENAVRKQFLGVNDE